MSKKNPWFRLYTEIIDDEKLALVAFEDRWHYISILCCKGKGLLDKDEPTDFMRRKIAVKLGLSVREAEEAMRRLSEIGVVDAETWQPTGWDDRQFESDSSTQRVADWRAKKKQKCNVTVTPQDTDTDTDTDTDKTSGASKAEIAKRKEDAFAVFWSLYPNKKAKPNAQKAWMKIPLESHEAIFLALPKHIKSGDWVKDGGKFIPHPATWLNAERWEDEIAEGQPDRSGKGGGAWWLDDASRMKKAAEVGVASIPGESAAAFDARIREAINNGGKPPERKPSPVVRVSMEQGDGWEKPQISDASRAALLAAAGIKGRSGA